MSKYYNLDFKNTTNKTIPLRFDVALNIPIIEKPTDYDVSVVRFELPNFERPILEYTNDTNRFKMTMSYNGTYLSQHVQYIPRTEGSDRGIWEIKQCIQMLNTTIGTLYTALNSIITLPSSDMPYFTYNETTHLISYTANKNYFLSSLSTPIVISIDQDLLNWLYSLPLYGRLINSEGIPTIYDLLVVDVKNNTVSTNYLEMKQEAPSFDRISDFSRIILTTSLPILNEYVGSSTTLPILQDYTPSDLTISTYYNNIVYNAIFPYRQTRLIGDMPFYNVKVDCYTMSRDGSMTPMFLQPNNSANIKLMFCKHLGSNFI